METCSHCTFIYLFLVVMSDLRAYIQYELSDLSKNTNVMQGANYYKTKRSVDHGNPMDPDPNSQLSAEGISKRLFNKFIIKSAPWKHKQMRRRDKVSLIEKASNSIAQSIMDLHEANVVAVDLPASIIDQFIGMGSSISDEAISNTFKNLTSSHRQYVSFYSLFFKPRALIWADDFLFLLKKGI